MAAFVAYPCPCGGQRRPPLVSTAGAGPRHAGRAYRPRGTSTLAAAVAAAAAAAARADTAAAEKAAAASAGAAARSVASASAPRFPVSSEEERPSGPGASADASRTAARYNCASDNGDLSAPLPATALNSAPVVRGEETRNGDDASNPSEGDCLTSARESEPSAVERALRALGADSAADSAFIALQAPSKFETGQDVAGAAFTQTGTRADTGELQRGARVDLVGEDDCSGVAATSPCDSQILPGSWHDVLQLLAEAGWYGEALSSLLERGGMLYVLSLDADRVRAVLQLLKSDIGFSQFKLFHVLTQRPTLLEDETSIQFAVQVLRRLHFTNRDIQNASYKWPGLLCLDFERAHAVIDCLCAPSVGFTTKSLRSLVRRAPWVLVYEIDRDILPALAWLRESVLISHPSLSVESVVRASPQILGTAADAMNSVVCFLRDVLLLQDDIIVSIVRQFPAILTSSVKEVLQPTASYLLHELRLSTDDLSRIVRAFPAILCLDVATEIEPNVRFFREEGIANVGRIVSRLPPVLSYDIRTNLAPKMEYLKKGLGLSVYDVLLFPGYFSYSLTECIEPRTRFLQKLGVPLVEYGLNMALSTTDEVFCERVANTDVASYTSFRLALMVRRDRLKNQRSIEERDGHAGSGTRAQDAPTDFAKESSASGLTTDLSLATVDPANQAEPETGSDILEFGETSAAILPKSLLPLTAPRPRRRRRKPRATDARVPWRSNCGSNSSPPTV